MCFRGWDIEMVIAEPDAVIDDNAIVAAADAADLRDLQGPDYFGNVAQEQQGQLGDSRDCLHASVMVLVQGAALGLNLLSYRPTGQDHR